MNDLRMTIPELTDMIDTARREWERSGPVHRRDLARFIQKLEKEKKRLIAQDTR